MKHIKLKLVQCTGGLDMDWVQIRVCIPKFCVFVFELKITKGYVFVFDLYLVCICKYNQIHIKITILPTKGNALPDINWPRSLDRMFFKPVVWSTVGRHSARQHWKNWPTVKLVKHYNIHHVWNAVALCIPSQGSWCSITLPLVAFTATYKLPRLPIHSLVLIFDQCSQCCLPTVDHTTGVKNILSRLLIQFMSGTHCDTLEL